MSLACTWFAVIVPLSDVFLDRYAEYGKDTKGALRKVTDSHQGKSFALVFSAGAALRELAQQKALEHSGIVIEVHAKYMFNTTDLVRTLNELP